MIGIYLEHIAPKLVIETMGQREWRPQLAAVALPRNARIPVLSAIDPAGAVGRGMHQSGSHALDHSAISLLGGLGRCPENLPDRAPGNTGRPGFGDCIDNLPLASSTIRRGSLEKVLLDWTLVSLIGFILLKAPRQVIAVIKYVLD